MRYLLYIFLIVSIVSCDIQKQASKSKIETDIKELYEKIEKRDGGQATFTPIIEKHYKDTVIVVKGTNGTELKVIYDKQGNTSQIDCNAALIDVIERYNMQRNETVKEKDKEKTESFDPSPFIWALAGLAFVVLLVLMLMVYLLYKIKKTVPA